MKFLVDANLPLRLCAWLKSHRHDAEHVFDLSLLPATDTELWQRGRAERLVIVSKDVDFYDRALLFGGPPQVIHVGVGNCSNDRLLELLTREWNDIERALLTEIPVSFNYLGENRSVRVNLSNKRSAPDRSSPIG